MASAGVLGPGEIGGSTEGASFPVSGRIDRVAVTSGCTAVVAMVEVIVILASAVVVVAAAVRIVAPVAVAGADDPDVGD